jgi:hypothetical protein
MRNIILLLATIIVVGCGPQEGDEYHTKMNGEQWTVTVRGTGTFESLANQAKMIKEMADTSSVIDKNIVLNKDLDSDLKDNRNENAILYKWTNQKYVDLYDRTQTLTHYRVSTTEEFNSIFSKVE